VNQIFTKMVFKYKRELVSADIDWLGECRYHVMWWKSDLYVQFRERSDLEREIAKQANRERHGNTECDDLGSLLSLYVE
jgi:hypothetical protein